MLANELVYRACVYCIVGAAGVWCGCGSGGRN